MQENASSFDLDSRATAVGLSLLGLLSAARMLVTYSALGHPIPIADAVVTGLVDWFLFAPLLPLALHLARSIPFTKRSFPRALSIHGLGAALCACVQIACFAAFSTLVRRWRYGDDSFAAEIRTGFAAKFASNVLVYFAFLGGWHAWRASRRADALTRSLAETRLAALASQLRPHFLFNALNTIADLVTHDPEAAERAVLDLGDLLRAALRRDGEHEVTLRDEMALLDRYLRIQRARFMDRLRVTTSVDESALDLQVPVLLLQPIVENALKHGTKHGTKDWEEGDVTIRARHRGARLELEVENTASKWPARTSDDGNHGFGLSSTRERLTLLYGDAECIVTMDDELGSTLVRIDLPASRIPHTRRAR